MKSTRCIDTFFLRHLRMIFICFRMKLRSLRSISRKSDKAPAKNRQSELRVKASGKLKPPLAKNSGQTSVELKTKALLKSLKVELKSCRVMLTRIDLRSDLLDLNLTHGVRVCLSERSKRMAKRNCLQAPISEGRLRSRSKRQ